MKIAVISDSHGYIPPVKRLEPHLKEVDLICHCGDGYEDGQKITAHFGKPLKQVRGNCDAGVAGEIFSFSRRRRGGFCSPTATFLR